MARQIDDTEPIIGKMYEVPCVWNTCHQKWLPVLGIAHTDNEIAPQVGAHYHYDFRFLSDNAILDYICWMPSPLRVPMAMGHVHQSKDTVIEYKRRRCARTMPVFPERARSGVENKVVRAVEKMCSGKKINVENPVCPHRGMSLKGLPVENDCVVCPLHGLKWNIKTGEMVSRLRQMEAGLNPQEIANTP